MSARPRQIQPAIALDLETIVVKAMERHPAQRYPSAEALAEDLLRFLDDRTIRALREQPERAWRWCRRNRAIAALLAALLFVFLTGSAGVVWQWRER